MQILGETSCLLTLLLATVLCCRPPDTRCDDEKCVKDESPCDISLYGVACPPRAPLVCKNSSFCYSIELHCDGKVDCPGGSDEDSCEKRVCAAGAEKCAHGPCAKKDSESRCCETEGSKCVLTASRFTWVLETVGKRIIYAEGREIFSVSIGDGRRLRIARSDCCEITALSYSVTGNKVFWTAGQYIWERGLGDRNRKRYVGVLNMGCHVSDMAYDWIAGNFYFVCGNERVMVCERRPWTKLMWCADLTKVGNLIVTSIALQPNLGIMYLASPSSPIFQIYKVFTDGGSPRQIFESEKFSAQQRHVKVGPGEVQEFSWKFVEEVIVNPDLKTLQRLQIRGKEFMRFSWDGTELYLPLNGTFHGHIVSLFDEKRQPPGINYCEHKSCEQLCVLGHGRATCMCDSDYELMQDHRTCCSRRDENCLRRDHSVAEPPAIHGCGDLRKILFFHVSYIAAVFSSWLSGIACFFLGRRRRSVQESSRLRERVTHSADEKCTNGV